MVTVVHAWLVSLFVRSLQHGPGEVLGEGQPQ